MRSFPHGAVFTFDTNLRYLSAGGLGLGDVGLSRELLEGKTIYEAFPAATAAAIAPAYRAALAGVPSTTDVPFEGRTFVQRLAPIRDHDGTIVAAMGFTQHVTESRADAEALRDSEERLRHNFAYAPIGKAIVGLDGTWRQVNRALTNLTGYTEAELLASTFQEITHPDDLDADLQHLQDLLAGETDSYDMEKRYFTAAGATVWVLLTVTLVRDTSDEPLYFIAQIQDITQRKAEHEALQTLIAMLSHDLRSPIAVAIGYADILSASWADLDDDKRLDFLHRISAAGRAAQALLEDTLTVSAMNAQGMTTRPSPVEVDVLVRACLISAGDEAALVDTSKLRHEVATVDPTHLTQVVANLVSNALKYGEPPFEASLADEPDAIILRISDSGRGVAPGFVPQLFELFARSPDAQRGGVRGTGLGLYIVRELLTLNSGSIWHETTPGGGATFAVKLPRAKPTETGVPVQ